VFAATVFTGFIAQRHGAIREHLWPLDGCHSGWSMATAKLQFTTWLVTAMASLGDVTDHRQVVTMDYSLPHPGRHSAAQLSNARAPFNDVHAHY